MYENLVFEGGGIKGIAYGGALKILYKHNILQDIKRVAGTSAGAITATLLAIGYNYEEISDIVAETNFNNFSDDSFGVIRDFNRIFTDYGYHKGDAFKVWMENLIFQKLKIPHANFSDLKKFNNGKDLFVVATNLTKKKPIVFSYKTSPEVKIANAVRMSMSIPMYFQCVRHKGDVIVDGGVSWNYPIDLFDTEMLNEKTLGLKLITTEEINHKETPIDDIGDYALSLVDYVIELANDHHVKFKDKSRTILINTGDISVTDFDITNDQKKTLMYNGEKATIDFLKQRV